MNKRIFMKTLAFAFCACLFTCMAGCGKKEIEQTKEVRTKGAWSVEQVSLANDSFYIREGTSENNFHAAGDMLCPVYAENHLYYVLYPKDGSATAEIQGIDLAQPDKSVTCVSFPFEEGKETNIRYLQYNDEGSLTYLKEVSPEFDTNDPDMSVEEAMEVSVKALDSVVTLETVSLEKGTVTDSLDVSDVLSSFAIYSCVSDGQENLYIRGASLYPSDSGYIDSEAQFVILNMKSGAAEKINHWEYYHDMVVTGNHEVFDIIENGDRIIFRPWDEENREFASENKVMCSRANSYGFLGCYAGMGDTILYMDKENIYQCNVKSKEAEVLLNLEEWDIAGDENLLVAAIDENTLYIFSTRSNYSGFTIDFFSVTAVNLSEIPKKTELVLLCRSVNNYISALIADFNRMNAEYQIKIEEISEPPQAVFIDDLESLETEPVRDIFLDAVTDNKRGDLILLSDLHELPDNGDIFEDIYPYIQSDAELSQRNLNTNLLRLYEANKRLITLPAMCYLNILIGDSSLIGSEPFTIEQAVKIINENPDKILIKDIRQDELMKLLFYQNREYFIDFEENTCCFTDGTFEKLLLVADSLAEYKKMQPYWEEYGYVSAAALAPQGTQFFYNRDYFDSKTYQIAEALFGENCRIGGYPGIDGEKILARTDEVLFAIRKDSKYKEACFEFMKYVFEYRIREKQSGFFPIDNDILKEKIADEIADTKEEEYDMYDETVLNLHMLSKENGEKVFELVNSVNVLDDWNNGFHYSEILQILNDETDKFIENSQTAEKTCENMQNRVTDFLQKER